MNWFWKSINKTRALRKGLMFGLFMAPPVGAIAGVVALFLTYNKSIAIGVAAVAGLLFYAFSVRYILVNEKNLGDAWQQRQAEQWIASGRVPEEIKRRQSVWDKQGWAGVSLGLAAATAVAVDNEPMSSPDGFFINIDGTPGYNGIDQNGNPFGVTYNSSTDSLVGSSGQYDSPFDDNR